MRVSLFLISGVFFPFLYQIISAFVYLKSLVQRNKLSWPWTLVILLSIITSLYKLSSSLSESHRNTS